MMEKIKTYRDLLIWRKSIDLVTDIYRGTKGFPKEELYGLTTQIRRSAISIPSNIAEGYGRKSTNDYVRFLRVAIASLYELQTQIEIGLNLEYFSKAQYDNLHEASREIERMMSSLISKISSKSS